MVDGATPRLIANSVALISLFVRYRFSFSLMSLQLHKRISQSTRKCCVVEINRYASEMILSLAFGFGREHKSRRPAEL